MRVISKQEMCRQLVESWKQLYAENPNYGSPDGRSKVASLAELGDDYTPDDVARITGNVKLSTIDCDQCGRDVDAIVILGEKELGDGEGLCADCLRRALELLTASHPAS